jgi:hypothetical protein
VFASPRRVRFVEMEQSVPREAFPEAFARARRLFAERGRPEPFPVECRWVAGDDADLSPAHGDDRAYLAVHLSPRRHDAGFFAAIEEALVPLGARPHWGKLHQRTAADLARAYPRWSASRRSGARSTRPARSPTTTSTGSSDRSGGRCGCDRPLRRATTARPRTTTSTSATAPRSRAGACPRRSSTSTASRINARALLERAGDRPIRVASKSVRCTGLLRHLAPSRRATRARCASPCPRRCTSPRPGSTTCSSPTRPSTPPTSPTWRPPSTAGTRSC